MAVESVEVKDLHMHDRVVGHGEVTDIQRGSGRGRGAAYKVRFKHPTTGKRTGRTLAPHAEVLVARD